MKTKLLILVTIMLSFQHLCAQEYVPLAVDGAHWIIEYDHIDTFDPIDALWEYYASGDTMINNLNYKKIYKRDLIVTLYGPPFEANGHYELYGFIRDDSLNKKVYAINLYDNSAIECPINEEFLLFDFSLNEGDTADLCIMPYGDDIIQNIQYVEAYGFYTYCYNLVGYISAGSICEGIGSSYGLFEEMFAPFKKKNNRYIYSTYLGYYCRESPCDLLVSTPEAPLTEELSIYPNPATSYIIFEFPVIARYKVPKQSPLLTITNTFGQQIAQLEIKDTKTLWDTRKVQAGVYFYFVEIAGKRFSGKMVVQK
ncbi:MAG: T9SS type A sorting domain-containing protein [Bacteroidetes bacterium]|nr:T9SS type A sorting domain-containing protein [Bacteroidota bacterium]